MDRPPQPDPTPVPPSSPTAVPGPLADGGPQAPQSPATGPGTPEAEWSTAAASGAAQPAQAPAAPAPATPEPGADPGVPATEQPSAAAFEAGTPRVTHPAGGSPADAGVPAPGPAFAASDARGPLGTRPPPDPGAESHTAPLPIGPAIPAGDRPQWSYGVTRSQPRPTFYDPDATPLHGNRVPPPAKAADPFAVAVGNASLLGVGYLLLGRKVLAVLAGLVTVGLLLFLLTASPTVGVEFVIVGWWVAVVVHGWVLARSRPRPRSARGQWVAALAAALPVLLAFGLLRFDAAGIEQDTDKARAAGDCAAALESTGKLWFGHELADAPLTVRADGTVRACAELRAAGRALGTALGGDTDALAAGFEDLRGVLTDLPGHEEMVRSTMDRFLGALPVDDPCDTKAVTDWLGKEKPRGAVLGDAGEVVPRIAPDAIVACADSFMAKSDWQSARQRYQQLLDQYPDHELAPEAQAGATKATQAIELANVRTLLTPAAGSTPAYCDKPAPYSGAKPYVPNAPNRALVFGNDAHTGKIPPGWKATDAADAVVVICAGETEYGAPVETCPYQAPENILGYTDVTFHKIAIPLRVFEVRSGRLVASFKLEIGGASCPAVLEYTSYSYVDLGPPSQVYVAASIPDVQGAFRPMLVP